MRTTLQIDDDVLGAARSLAKARDQSLGQVISALARKGLADQSDPVDDAVFPTFKVPTDAAPLTFEIVRQADEGA